jgi:hypothetical protein
MAIVGWLTEKEALHYTQSYDREDAAAGVVVRFPGPGRAAQRRRSGGRALVAPTPPRRGPLGEPSERAFRAQ